eukprot:PhM_4_TR10578/c0_g1_i2/m.26297
MSTVIDPQDPICNNSGAPTSMSPLRESNNFSDVIEVVDENDHSSSVSAASPVTGCLQRSASMFTRKPSAADLNASASSSLVWQTTKGPEKWETFRQSKFLLYTKNNDISMAVMKHEARLLQMSQQLVAEGEAYMTLSSDDSGLMRIPDVVQWNPLSSYTVDDIVSEYKLKATRTIIEMPTPVSAEIRTTLFRPEFNNNNPQVEPINLDVFRIVEKIQGLPHAHHDLRHVVDLASDAAITVASYDVDAFSRECEEKRVSIKQEQYEMERQHASLVHRTGRRCHSASPHRLGGSPPKNPFDKDVPTEMTSWSWHARAYVNQVSRELQDMVSGELSRILQRRTELAEADMTAVMDKMRSLFSFASQLSEREQEFEEEVDTLKRDVRVGLEFVRRRRRWAEDDITLLEGDSCIETPEDPNSVLRETAWRLTAVQAEQDKLLKRLAELAEERTRIVQSCVRRLHRSVDLRGRTGEVRKLTEQHTHSLRVLAVEDAQREAQYLELEGLLGGLIDVRRRLDRQVGQELREQMIKAHEDVVHCGCTLHRALHEQSRLCARTVQQAESALQVIEEHLSFCRDTKDPDMALLIGRKCAVEEWLLTSRRAAVEYDRKMEDVLKIVEPSDAFLKSLTMASVEVEDAAVVATQMQTPPATAKNADEFRDQAEESNDGGGGAQSAATTLDIVSSASTTTTPLRRNKELPPLSSTPTSRAPWPLSSAVLLQQQQLSPPH